MGQMNLNDIYFVNLCSCGLFLCEIDESFKSEK